MLEKYRAEAYDRSAMRASVVGRDAELAALEKFLASIPDGATVLVLEGEAGMGKTTLWRRGAADAEARGWRVLQALPAESETAIGYSALGDLLDPVLDEALAPLPLGQRSALSHALVLEEVVGPAPDEHAVGVAVLGVLRSLGERTPTLIAVDDVQWLDSASAGALAFAARRLRGEPVGVLLSRRTGLDSALLDELRRAHTGDRFVDVDVGPLDVASLHEVVLEHLGVALPRPLLAEVHQASGGNPFYALEIVRMLKRSSVSIEAGQPIRVPDSLHDLVHGRLLALPAESRDFLLAAAAHAHPTLSITEAASGVRCADGLSPALEARVVELDAERIRFTHPLLASGAYELADPLRRREIHQRLADVLQDPEARAWQLAASADQPDEGVAAALESAADVARARGALRPAGLLLDRAHELTPPERPDDALRRAVDAAFLHFESGDLPRAEAQLRVVSEASAAGAQRAKALWVLARVRTYEAPDEAAALFFQLVEEAEGDPELLAIAHEGVASTLLWLAERYSETVEHAEAAFRLALELGNEALAGDALVSQLLGESWLGRSSAVATAEKALALQATTGDRRLLDQPLIALAQYWMWVDQLDRGRRSLIEMLASAQELGDESARPYVLALLAQVEYLLGNLDRALVCARDGETAAVQSGQPLFVPYHLALEGLVTGNRERAREAVDRAHALMPRTGGESGLIAAASLAHIELALGNVGETATCLEPKVELVLREGMTEPGAIRFVVDQIEALIELGRREDAIELLDWYEGNARRLERVSALANCMRCRGLLAAQAGDLDSAMAAFEGALDWHAQVELPLDRGRTVLALGATQRRMKRRREARATLEEALNVFERIGAAIWAERARAELKRISGRAATPGALTPAEERVAALVAAGKTNKEVAAALFLSDRTVEGHLAHIFGKLGIRHRGEIAGVLQTQGIGAPNTGDSPVSAQPPAS
jgi:DNA-binding CsgD family transcriptional regulator